MFKYYLSKNDGKKGVSYYCNSKSFYGTNYKGFNCSVFNEKAIIFFDTEEEAQAEKLKMSNDKRVLKGIYINKISDLWVTENN